MSEEIKKESFLESKSISMFIAQHWLKPRTIFASLFYLVFCYLIMTGKPIPDALLGIVNMLMGFYFGKKIADMQNKGGVK